MPALDPRLDGWVDALVERTRVQLRTELDRLTAQLAEAVERQHAEAAREARAAAEAAATAVLTDALAAERARAAQHSEQLTAGAAAAAATAQAQIDTLTAELSALRARAEQDAVDADRARAAALASAREADPGALHGLAGACSAFDAAATLSDVLTALVQQGASRACRCALLVVKAGTLRGWDLRGFDAAADAGALEIRPDDRTPVARAWRRGARDTSTPDEAGAHLFTPRTGGRIGLALPIRMDGQVVAILYADDDDGEGRQVPGAWPDELDLLVRYAGRCLEALTVRRVPELMRASAAERSRAQTAQQDDESARRYARLLVAEIKLYHEAALEDARREGDILRRLRPQIERAQALYNERVPSAQRARTTYFEDELVRTLAGGDQALLGQAT